MKHQWDVKLTAALGIFLFVLLCLFKGPGFVTELYGIAMQAISYTVIGRFIFVKWVWKWIPILEKVHGVPKIEGKWKGEYQSTWRASPTSPFATGPVDVTISQPSIYMLKITQKTGESISHSYGEIIETLEDGTMYLNFSYRNVPDATVRDRSQINYGSARYLLTRGESQTMSLSGSYWTDRKSTGSINLIRQSVKTL